MSGSQSLTRSLMMRSECAGLHSPCTRCALLGTSPLTSQTPCMELERCGTEAKPEFPQVCGMFWHRTPWGVHVRPSVFGIIAQCKRAGGAYVAFVGNVALGLRSAPANSRDPRACTGLYAPSAFADD